MGRRKKKGSKKSAPEETTVIDLEEKREKRRAELRARADASRKKRGVKSIEETMMEEVAAEDLHVERQKYEKTYSIGDAISGAAKEGAAVKKGRRGRRKPMSAYMKIVVTVLIFVMIVLAMSIGQIVNLKMQENDAQERVTQLRAEKEKLEAQTAAIGTDETIEKQARDWLKMAKQGETLYMISDSAKAGSTSTAVGSENSASAAGSGTTGQDANAASGTAGGTAGDTTTTDTTQNQAP